MRYFDPDEKNEKNHPEPDVKVISRCPKCGNIGFGYDDEQKALVCKKCGYKQPIMK